MIMGFESFFFKIRKEHPSIQTLVGFQVSSDLNVFVRSSEKPCLVLASFSLWFPSFTHSPSASPPLPGDTFPVGEPAHPLHGGHPHVTLVPHRGDRLIST